MRQLWKTGILLLALVLLIGPILSACASSATPTPTATKPAAAATKPAAEATKPAAAPTKPAAQATPAAQAPKPAEAAKPAAAAKPPSGDPIVVGSVNSASGYMASMGAPERDAVLALEEKINAEGGINGRPLKVIFYDDESNESKGVLAIKKLIEQDKVLALSGTCASGIAMAQVPIVEAAKVPFVTMNSARSILEPPKKYIYKLPLSERFYIEGMFVYLKDQKLSKIGLLTQGAGFGKEAKKYFEDNVDKHGIKIVANESYGPNDTDITAPLTKIKAANPEVLVIYGAEAAGAIAARQAKELGINVPMLTLDSITMAAIMNVKELRDGLEGITVVGHKPDVYKQLPDTDKQKKIIAAADAMIQKKYNRPAGMWEGNGYDSFMVLVEAIKRANVDPTKVEEAREKIREALDNTKNFVGMSNIISYSPTDHEIINTASMALLKIEKGAFKLVKTY